MAPAYTDGERTDGNAAGHLGHGEKRIETFERLGFDRNSENRNERLGGGHSRQMRSAACSAMMTSMPRFSASLA